MKKFSANTIIGILCFNEEKFIRQTCASLARQDIDDCLFVFSENLSTDGSRRIIEEFCDKDERFRCVNQSVQLTSIENVNALIAMADCKYFSFMGGHDMLSDNYVSKAVNMLENNPDVAIAFGRPYWFYQNHKRAKPLYKGVYQFSDDPVTRLVELANQLKDCTFSQGLMRREDIGSYRFKMIGGPDKLLVQRILWKGNLRYLDGERFYRRYFRHQRQTYDSRHSVVKHDTRYVIESLKDWDEFYSGPPELKQIVRQEFASSLMRQDMLYLQNKKPKKFGHALKDFALYLKKKMDRLTVG